jgi:hypothetical protein
MKELLNVQECLKIIYYYFFRLLLISFFLIKCIIIIYRVNALSFIVTLVDKQNVFIRLIVIIIILNFK